jgi:hypothetical protein
MKRNYKWFFSFSILMMVFTWLPTLASADPIIGGDDCEAYNDPMAVCPIDGGLGVLIAIGVGYGIKKVKEMRGNG